MGRYRVRAIILAGAISVFAVWVAPVRSQEQEPAAEANAEQVEAVTPAKPADPKAAKTTKELDIPVDELKLLVKPLTLEQLQVEAAGWMLALQNKAQEISEAEVTIKRQNLAIAKQKEGADALEKAKQALEEAQTVQKGATPGSPQYQEAAKKVEEAQENLKKAQEAVEEAKKTKADLNKDATAREALEKAQKTGNLDTAKQTLEQTKADQDKMRAGSLAYQDASKKIEKLEAAIKEFEDAQEAQKGAKEDSPEYKKATEQLEKADAAIEKLLKEFGVNQTDKTKQSSQDLNKATAALENTEIENNSAEKVAGLPGVVNNEQQLQQKEQQLEKTQEKLEKSAEIEAEAKNQLVTTVTELQGQQTALIDRLNVVLDELEKKGGDPKPYRQYIQAISTVEVDTKDTEGLGLRLVSWAQSSEGGLRWAGNIGKFFGIMIASVIISQILGMMLNQILFRFGNTSAIMRQFLVMLVKRGGVVVGFLLALTALEVSLGPVLALLGGVSFVLAFALQSNLGNLASGLMIMVNKPFDVGDEVKIGSLWGWVDAITIANTRIKGFGGQIFTLPNNSVWNDTIENLSHDKNRKIMLSFRVGFDENLQEVEALIVETLKSHPKVLADPAPSTFVWQIEDYYISIFAGGWTKKDDFWETYADIIRLIQKRFNEEGINLAAIPKAIEIQQEYHETNGKTHHLPAAAEIPPQPANVES
ncbi:mechanosensitive ion channel domain-containing protein [Aerosakkonemataceae cyanobacterium BLCC-F154]|uniref:Mechanosensitive ion channel domain-containing protein n=1 Tax=Floridaenema fluviatile BLCC-F154 TaxID=3153640 RepID=A0ABV4YI53_9CYAN